MVNTSTSGMLITLGAGSTVAYLGFIEPYVPFLIGGISLYSYMVSNNEIEFNLKNAMQIISMAILIGYLTLGMVEPLSEIAYNFLLTHLDPAVVANSKSLTSGKFASSLSNSISFTLAGLSRTIFNTFFSKRSEIVDTIIHTKGGK